MLNRDYSSVTVHSATPTAEGDANTMRVQNYQELVNALIYLINQGEESGSIRYSGEEADFKKLMDEACLEVKQEDPGSLRGGLHQVQCHLHRGQL